MTLKPYPEYKDSGVQWLGKVPKEWEIRKTKYLFDERVEKGYPNETLLAATQKKGVVPKTHYETRTVIAQKDLHLLKRVMKNDFVISLRSFQGGIELAYFQGIISPAYTIMVPYEIILVRYFKYLAKSKPFIKLLTMCVTGIREGQNVDYEILKRHQLPLPPLPEQAQIARFLDMKTTQIAKFIKDKKRIIELLKEQKQIIINEAVTGKIDVTTGKPYPKYKDSGVEWLGQVPEGWEVISIKRITNFVKTGGTPQNLSDKHFSENGYLWFTPGDLGDSIYLEKSERCLSEIGLNDVNIFPENTIYFVGIGATIGKTGICKKKASCNQQINAMSVNSKLFSEYLVYILISMKNYILNCGKYTTLPIINQDDLKRLLILIANIYEQKQIIEYIKNKVLIIDLTISRIEREIFLIQEYRDRLIADVVTGKVDVRGIKVPDVEEEVVVEDEREEVDESEIIVEDE